jgi:hypothetical protein
MIRFLGSLIFFIIVAGFILHFGVEIPWLSGWIGQLPGDLIIKKGNVTLYIPLATSLLASVVFSLIGRSK